MNPFAALESDDEDESFTKVQSSKKTESKKPTQAKPAASAAAPAVTTNNADKKNSGRGGGGRGDNRSKGRGAGRGGKETGDRKNGKREYDRRSGTGRGTEVSKGGAGKAGWGSNKDEIAAQTAELAEGEAPVDKVKEKVEEEPVEPEVPTFTMDEFLAKREAERSSSTIFKKVEERKVTDDFSNMKKGSDDLTSFIVLGAGAKAKGTNGKGQRVSAQTKVTDLGFHAAPKEENREERGGRGDRSGGKGSRGGRGGGERRSAPRAGGKVDINDQSLFPSL